MPQKATVGRIVHYYDDALANRDPMRPGHGINGQRSGPYPAIVTQVFGDLYANLKVLPGYGEPFDAGSVSHKDDMQATGHGENPSRYWEWPPRD